MPNPPQTHTLSPEVEERFDRKFGRLLSNIEENDQFNFVEKDVKDFIAQEIALAEQRGLERQYRFVFRYKGLQTRSVLAKNRMEAQCLLVEADPGLYIENWDLAEMDQVETLIKGGTK